MSSQFSPENKSEYVVLPKDELNRLLVLVATLMDGDTEKPPAFNPPDLATRNLVNEASLLTLQVERSEPAAGKLAISAEEADVHLHLPTSTVLELDEWGRQVCTITVTGITFENPEYAVFNNATKNSMTSLIYDRIPEQLLRMYPQFDLVKIYTSWLGGANKGETIFELFSSQQELSKPHIFTRAGMNSGLLELANEGKIHRTQITRMGNAVLRSEKVLNFESDQVIARDVVDQAYLHFQAGQADLAHAILFDCFNRIRGLSDINAEAICQIILKRFDQSIKDQGQVQN